MNVLKKSLFKSGDPIIDLYNNNGTEQLIQIVTNTSGHYFPGVVEAARRSPIKGWFRTWLVFGLVRLVACLMKHN